MTALFRVAFLFLVSPAFVMVVPIGEALAEPPKDTPAEVDARARAAFEAGRQAYDEGAFAEALRHYEVAYALSSRPGLLFNIGRAADSNGQPERAESAYIAYLEALPSADNRKFVEARLEVLRASAKQNGNPQAGPAQETERDAEPAGYRELVDEALREYDAGNYEEARTLFSRAHGVFPNARTLRGMGKAEFELRNYAESVAQLEQAMASGVRPLDAKLRADTETLLTRARAFLGWLIVHTKPAASEVRIDGVPVDVTTGQPVSVKLGEHVIEASVAGYAPEKRQVRAVGGATQTLTIVFTRALETEQPETKRRSWAKNPWLWGAVGVVVAGAAVGTGIAVGRGSKQGPYDRGTTGLLPTGPGAE